MKNCQHCRIEVGGTAKRCPLCQSPLVGESEAYWPSMQKIKSMSLFLKILLFLAISGVIVAFALDFMLIGPHDLHWSLLIAMWFVVVSLMISHFARIYRRIPKMLFETMIVFGILIMVTAHYTGFEKLAGSYILPIVCAATLVFNFVACMIDRGYMENALVYLLLNIIVGIIPYIVLILWWGEVPLPWIICLLLSAITFAGLCVFKGPRLLNELQKRLHV